MVALVAPRNTQELMGQVHDLPMAAATIILAGALTCLNATGFATKGVTSLTIRQFGRAEETVDNTLGVAGARNIKVETGIFGWANQVGDLVTAADIGTDCFIVDDQTVARTTGAGTRSRAGKVMLVDARGVFVQMGPQF